MEGVEKRSAADRGGELGPAERRSRRILERQQLEPAMAVPAPELPGGRGAQPAVPVVEDDERRLAAGARPGGPRNRLRAAEVDRPAAVEGARGEGVRRGLARAASGVAAVAAVTGS